MPEKASAESSVSTTTSVKPLESTAALSVEPPINVPSSVAPSGDGFNYGLLAFILVLILLVLLLILACGAGVFYYYRKKQKKVKLKKYGDLEAGSSAQTSELWSRNSKPQRERRISQSSSPSSDSSSVSDESPYSKAPNKKGKNVVYESSKYPTNVTTNGSGDKEITIKGLPTGDLVLVIKNKRSSSYSPRTKVYSSTKIAKRTSSATVKKSERKEPVPSSESTIFSGMATSTPPTQSPPPSSRCTVSLTKKQAKQKAPKRKDKQSLPSSIVSPAKVMKKSRNKKSMPKRCSPTPDSLQTHTVTTQPKENVEDASPQNKSRAFAGSGTSLSTNKVISSPKSRDDVVSAENWFSKSAFPSPMVLSSTPFDEKVKGKETVWNTTFRGQPVRGRTTSLNSYRRSWANPKQMAKQISVATPLVAKQRSGRLSSDFAPPSPAMSLSKEKTQSSSLPEVDKTQSLSSSEGSEQSNVSSWRTPKESFNIQ